MTKLLDNYYDAIVVTDAIDPLSMGAVKVKILGVTETLADNDQPWALPSVNSIQAVPTKGTNLRVEFDEGDINKPKYMGWSPKKSALPDVFVAEYPNIAVSNLGDDRFIMVHDRAKRDTGIIHPSDSSVSWNNLGQIIHDSEKGYNNAGQFRGSGGTKIHSVLTEATIDIFCCTPVGNGVSKGGAYQGSEYLFATHMAQSTYDRIVSGSTPSTNNNTTANPIEQPAGNDSSKKDLVDANGNVVQSIDFMPSPTAIKSTDEGKIRIIVGFIGHNNFAEVVNSCIDISKNFSVHYVVGTGANAQETSGNPDSKLTTQNNSFGIAQCADILTNDCSFASNAKFDKSTDPANKRTISIMLIGDGKVTNAYQYDMVSKILANAKRIMDNTGIELFTTNDLIANPAFATINFDKSKVL